MSTYEGNKRDRGCLKMGCKGEYFHLRGQNRSGEKMHGASSFVLFGKYHLRNQIIQHMMGEIHKKSGKD